MYEPFKMMKNTQFVKRFLFGRDSVTDLQAARLDNVGFIN